MKISVNLNEGTARRPAKRGETRRFIEAAISHNTDECLFWPFATNSEGYGQIRIEGKTIYVHRMICEIQNGASPAKHDAAHSCGNGHLGCVNPLHLRWATRKENVADTISHGTSHRGERHHSAKLSEQQVLAIRALKGSQTLARTAEQFSISVAQVNGIQNLTTWGWL